MPLKDSKTGCMGVAMGFSWVRCWDFLLRREHCYHWEVSLPRATCPVIETSSRARARCGKGPGAFAAPSPGPRAPASSLPCSLKQTCSFSIASRSLGWWPHDAGRVSWGPAHVPTPSCLPCPAPWPQAWKELAAVPPQQSGH